MDNIVKFKGINPQEVFDRPSAVRVGVVETMLKQHGFERIEGGRGSHFRYRFKDDQLNIDQTVGLIIKPGDDVNYQKAAAESCLAVREAKILKAKEQIAGMANSFSAASSVSGSVEILKNLPDSLTGEVYSEEDSLIAVRSKSYPQLGMILPESAPKEAIAGYEKSICSQEDRLSALIAKLKDVDCVCLVNKDGALQIVNSYAERVLEVPSYDPDYYQNPFDLLQSFHDVIEADYVFCNQLFDFDDGQSIQQVREEDDVVFWRFTWTPRLSAEDHYIDFEAEPDKPPAKSLIYSILDHIRDLDFGGVDDRKRLQRVLKDHAGFDLRKPKKSQDLVCHHPFYEGADFYIPDINALPKMETLHKRLLDSSFDIEKIELDQHISDISMALRNAREVLNTAIDYVGGAIKNADEEILDVVGEHRLKPASYKPLEIGKVGRLEYSNPYNREPMSVRFMMLKYVEGHNADFQIYHGGDVEGMKESLERARGGPGNDRVVTGPAEPHN